MEESNGYINIEGNNMEITLESDEEDASLIKEMEMEEHGKNDQSMETHLLIEENAGISHGEKVNEDKEEVYLDDIHDHMSKGDHVNEDVSGYLHGDLEKEFEFVSFSNELKICDTSFKEDRTLQVEQGHMGVEYELDGVQILKLDMSASELLIAKSAAALRSRTLSETVSFVSVASSEPQCPVPVKNYCSYDHLSDSSSNHTSSKQTSSQKRKKAVVHENQSVKKIKSGLTISCASSDVWLQENRNKFGMVSFLCNFCNFSIPFSRGNIEEILAHITPEVCYYHLRDEVTAEVLKDFKENVKMNVMVAKNKNKAKIRFVSYLVCRHCQISIPLDISHRELIVAHKNKCRFASETHHQCLFCRRMVHRSTCKKHFTASAKSYCRDSENIILQLMSCACQAYAGEHKPVCVVCGKKYWSLLGQHSYQKTVCKSCCNNICSGKTTLLSERALTSCALCNNKCSKNFVTYWASDLESLFIGENCIEALKNPKDSTVHEIVIMKREKIKTLLENSVSSLEIGNVESDPVVSSRKSELASDFKKKDETSIKNVMSDTCKKTESKLKNCEKYPSRGVNLSCNKIVNYQEVNGISKKKCVDTKTNSTSTHVELNRRNNELKQNKVIADKMLVNCDPSGISLSSNKNDVNYERNSSSVNFNQAKSQLNSENAVILQNSPEPAPSINYCGGFIPLMKSFRFMNRKISPLSATSVEVLPGNVSKNSGISSYIKSALRYNSCSTLFQEGKFMLLLPDLEGKEFSRLSPFSDSVNAIDGVKVGKPKIVDGNGLKRKNPNSRKTNVKRICKLKKKLELKERHSGMSRTGIVETNDCLNETNNIEQIDISSDKYAMKSHKSSVEITGSRGEVKPIIIKTRNCKKTDTKAELGATGVPESFPVPNKFEPSQTRDIPSTCIITVKYSAGFGAKVKHKS